MTCKAMPDAPAVRAQREVRPAEGGWRRGGGRNGPSDEPNAKTRGRGKPIVQPMAETQQIAVWRLLY